MKIEVLPFSKSYQAYYHAIEECMSAGQCILEVGGGAHPSLQDRSQVEYTIVDPDQEELLKAPTDIRQIRSTAQEMQSDKTYDLVVSKMVLEHVPNPESFHKSVLRLLKPGGRAIHFFACRNSLPAWVNRFLPESWGEGILKVLKNRDLTDQPKYEAHYKRVGGPTRKQIRSFEKLGYNVEQYTGFVGHKYLQAVPILRQLERLYSSLLLSVSAKRMSTVALLVLTKPK